MENNKSKIKELVKGLLTEAFEIMLDKQIDRAINSSAIDTDSWDERYASMITPKVIVIALLEEAADQYKCTGTTFGKKMVKDVKNLKVFI